MAALAASILLLAAVALATPLNGLSLGAADAPPGSVSIQLLAINDLHGQLPPPGGAPTGGLSYLAAHVRQLEAANHNSLFLSGGDLIGASPLVSALFHDEPSIEAMNELGMDLGVVGNHEFDEGLAELYRMKNGGCHPVDGCQSGHEFTGAEFEILAANVVGPNGHTIFPAYKIRSFAGARVGFIGVVTTATPYVVTPSAIAGLEFLDEAETVNRYAADLRARGINTIVVLFHGYPSDATVTELDPSVRIVVAGHSHGTSIRFVGDVIVTQAGSAGRNVTDIDLTIDRSTGLTTSISAVNVPITRDVDPDPATSELLAHYEAMSAPLANRVIGSITADLSGPILGRVIADAQLEATASAATGSAVVAFTNPGGVRDALRYAQISGGELPGEVTYAEAFSVQPFSNWLVTKTMTGAQLEAVLEQGMLYNSTGLSYTRWSRWDVTDLRIDGVPVDAGSSYRVTMNNFLATGGDGFSVFTEGTDELVGIDDLAALVTYFGAHSPVSPGP